MLLRTPAKAVIRENVVKQALGECTMADAAAAFHAAGLSSASGAPSGTDGQSYKITVSGMDDDFQKVQPEVNRKLKDRGCSLVSMSHHEEPGTGHKVHTCIVNPQGNTGPGQQVL
jgi:hypothetical protein